VTPSTAVRHTQQVAPDDIGIALSLGPDTPIVLCDARQRDSVKKVLTSLVRHVIGQTSPV
jgi:hypothetical protein